MIITCELPPENSCTSVCVEQMIIDNDEAGRVLREIYDNKRALQLRKQGSILQVYLFMFIYVMFLYFAHVMILYLDLYCICIYVYVLFALLS